MQPEPSGPNGSVFLTLLRRSCSSSQNRSATRTNPTQGLLIRLFWSFQAYQMVFVSSQSQIWLRNVLINPDAEIVASCQQNVFPNPFIMPWTLFVLTGSGPPAAGASIVRARLGYSDQIPGNYSGIHGPLPTQEMNESGRRPWFCCSYLSAGARCRLGARTRCNIHELS